MNDSLIHYRSGIQPWSLRNAKTHYFLIRAFIILVWFTIHFFRLLPLALSQPWQHSKQQLQHLHWQCSWRDLHFLLLFWVRRRVILRRKGIHLFIEVGRFVANEVDTSSHQGVGEFKLLLKDQIEADLRNLLLLRKSSIHKLLPN